MFDQLHSKALFLLFRDDHLAWLVLLVNLCSPLTKAVLQVNIDDFTLSASKYHFCYLRALFYKASRAIRLLENNPTIFYHLLKMVTVNFGINVKDAFMTHELHISINGVKGLNRQYLESYRAPATETWSRRTT